MSLRDPIDIRDVAMGQVCFATTGAFTWVGERELDSARLTIRRYGVAYIRSNAIDADELTQLHNAIRKSRGQGPQDAPTPQDRRP